MKTPPFLKDFIDLFFPRLCPVCQRALNRNEENICTTCLHRLPRTGYHLDPLSPMAQLFLGKVPIEKCAAFFFFSTPSDARQLIHHIKYHGGKQCGFTLGKIRERTAAQRIFRRHKRVGSRPLASGEITPQRIQSKRMDCSGNRTSHRNRSLHRMVIPLPKH